MAVVRPGMGWDCCGNGGRGSSFMALLANNEGFAFSTAGRRPSSDDRQSERAGKSMFFERLHNGTQGFGIRWPVQGQEQANDQSFEHQPRGRAESGAPAER